MTVKEAENILYELFSKPEIKEDDAPIYVECLKFLADEINDAESMYYLGDYYFHYDRFDLAEKYWELSVANGFVAGYAGLGDLCYLDECSVFDYKKAYYWYSKGADQGNDYCMYRIADMYHDGLYVKQDYSKYKSIIEKLYLNIKDEDGGNTLFPEVAFRLAGIRKKEGKKDEALELYEKTADFYAFRFTNRRFTGDIHEIIKTVEEIYKLKEFDCEYINIFDVSYLLKQPVKILFMYEDRSYIVESVEENGHCVIHFENEWYGSLEVFFEKARINNKLITTICYDLYGFEVIE